MEEHREHSETVDKQSASSQRASNLIVLSITAVTVGGIWWWVVGAVQAPWKNPGDRSKSTTVRKPPGNIAKSSNGNGKRHAKGGESSSVSVQHAPDSEFDASRTSWQDPFVTSFWKSTGWKFTPTAMQSNGTTEAVATFRREYRKVTVECEIAPIGEPGEFQIELFAAESDATMRAVFTQERIKLTSSIKGVDSIIKQRKFPVPFAAKSPTSLRLTATGNRALVVCDRKVVFNGSQPAEQSGKPLELSLRSLGGAFRITDLRLEGE